MLAESDAKSDAHRREMIERAVAKASGERPEGISDVAWAEAQNKDTRNWTLEDWTDWDEHTARTEESLRGILSAMHEEGVRETLGLRQIPSSEWELDLALNPPTEAELEQISRNWTHSVQRAQADARSRGYDSISDDPKYEGFFDGVAP